MLRRFFNIINKRNYQESPIDDNVEWNNIPSIKCTKEIFLKDYGGSRLFIEDINKDGIKEFIWLQSAGMFKSKIYDNFSRINEYNDRIKHKEVFNLAATGPRGDIIWSNGNPYRGIYPYLCHAPEEFLKFGDVNGDGIDEILVFDANSNLLVISPIDGRTIKTINLPSDNFAILYYIKTGVNLFDFVLLLGVMDVGYSGYDYANPWIILDHNFKIISSSSYKGAGHNAVIADFNNDGNLEIMIGYQVINLRGEVLWTIDYWSDKEIDSLEQHADNIQMYQHHDQIFLSISGSDKQYMINSAGKTQWIKSLPHPQYNLIGRYNNELRIFVVNQRQIMNSITIKGEEKWRGLLPEFWPFGDPLNNKINRPIHVNDPVTIIKAQSATGNDLMIYKEGGWPYIIDFNGSIKYRLEIPPTAKQEKPKVNFYRLNDIGLSYETFVSDVREEGKTEIYIYNRKYLWVYQIDDF